ncbi:UDP-N-acetylmuramate dehydrogenase [Weissella soli]|uniref:UDP-N-acetylenolpyruvoylglucosamine reductase n=1 Tax=Weissella soli TaxID=155866 RepID=A0A288QUI7_9LACO|nr:UDP-N-acetylmuramate dehydrogenase [Weissella soli]AOT56768.1 UDP-N-acetylmuramate dehydrogenase [Weissella soli]NKY83220.1 UDP-N-acetylmuramate dehydrogenase [Weissella soli]RDL12330.1 UDP-N-acetylmuramate dehydrogenase [Weissella soli]GEN92423.1 UDP-N-acetylenolpyruvoylglucosamine reductase [Weissella soli]
MENLIQYFPGYDIRKNVRLADYTNTRVGGPADWAFWPKTIAQVKTVIEELHASDRALPITVLGNASNLIITDDGLRGLVIFLTDLAEIQVVEQTITASAGAAIIDVARVAQQNGLTGLEWAAGIPGSVGGAVYMNAGAYGGQVDSVVSTIEVLTRTGEIKSITNADLAFAYRHSAVQETGDIILSATFALELGDKAAIDAMMEDFNTRRASKQPLEFPSCGSVFKRPVGYFAGKLIMDADLQGYTIGGAQVSTKHAGFIVNRGTASATDYIQVIRHVQQVVAEKYGVTLETEVRILGEQ